MPGGVGGYVRICVDAHMYTYKHVYMDLLSDSHSMQKVAFVFANSNVVSDSVRIYDFL